MHIREIGFRLKNFLPSNKHLVVCTDFASAAEPLPDGAIFLYDNSPFTKALLVLFSETGRKVRVTDTGSTVPAEPRNARHSVAHYNQPSAHPQERPQNEIQNSLPWCVRSRDSVWRRHRGRPF